MNRRKVAVLISGRGTNMMALLEVAKNPSYPAEIIAVISNKPDALGIERAKGFNIPTYVVNHKDFASREAFDGALHETLLKTGAEIVCLAGFMRLLTPEFTNQWLGRMINIHPSLLPAFKGAHAHRDVLAAGVDKSGCTVHFVIPEMDAGPIINQFEVPVYPNDTIETLSARVLEAEHKAYPEALKLLAEGKVKMEKGRVVFN